MGRRAIKLTPTIIKAVAQGRAAGLTWEKCGHLAGVSVTTMDKWKSQGEGEGAKEPYIGFLVDVQKAEADTIKARLAIIEEASLKSWQAAAWLLERCHPTVYGRQIREHTGPDGGPQEFAVKWQKPIGADEGSGE